MKLYFWMQKGIKFRYGFSCGVETTILIMRVLAGKVTCEIQRDGRVHIEGVMTEVGLMGDPSTVYQMKVQQLCPPGPFTISFNLPGPVDPRLFSPNFRSDGILEVVVMKHRAPQAEG